MAKKLIDIEHLAHLSRLQLSDEEKGKIAPQLEDILSYVGKLSEVNTTDTTNRAYITDAVNVWREDIVQECDEATVKSLIEAFPKKIGTALSVPGIFEERTE